MSQQTLQTINALQDIAKAIREREELIQAKLRKFTELTADLILDGRDQGKDLLLAKTKLGKAVRWDEWLSAHVPNLSTTQAQKYERLCNEQIADPRQGLFAFLPPADREAKPERIPPAQWEVAFGYITKLNRVAAFDGWPEEQVALTKDSIAAVVSKLGGKVVW